MGEKGKQILQALLQKHPELQHELGGVPQEEKGGSVPKAQIGAALYNLGRNVVNRLRNNSTEETETSTSPAPIAPSTPVRPTMTRADKDFSARVQAAKSRYFTSTDPGSYSRESGFITFPNNAEIRRYIAHRDGVSDTSYVYAPTGGVKAGSAVTFTPIQRQIIDDKLDNTQSMMYKCGGKVKKGEKGLPIPAKKVVKNAKGGCPCQLKKVGGKLVEVDSCTGKIVK